MHESAQLSDEFSPSGLGFGHGQPSCESEHGLLLFIWRDGYTVSVRSTHLERPAPALLLVVMLGFP